jgi:CheY-like chemotaxis protein
MMDFPRHRFASIDEAFCREVLARECIFSDTVATWLIPCPERRDCLAKILVIDDDVAVQATIRILLERAGHSVDAASDGRKGLELFEAGEFDLLFLDIFMPGMDGLETMRLVHQKRPLTPIIVISGRPLAWNPEQGPDFLTMATKLGALSSLQKPFKPAGRRCGLS